jgi:hypothetical protein
VAVAGFATIELKEIGLSPSTGILSKQQSICLVICMAIYISPSILKAAIYLRVLLHVCEAAFVLFSFSLFWGLRVFCFVLFGFGVLSFDDWQYRVDPIHHSVPVRSITALVGDRQVSAMCIRLAA